GAVVEGDLLLPDIEAQPLGNRDALGLDQVRGGKHGRLGVVAGAAEAVRLGQARFQVLEGLRTLLAARQVVERPREGQETERAEGQAHAPSSQRRVTRVPFAPPKPSELLIVIRGRPSGVRTRWSGQAGSGCDVAACTGRKPR